MNGINSPSTLVPPVKKSNVKINKRCLINAFSRVHPFQQDLDLDAYVHYAFCTGGKNLVFFSKFTKIIGNLSAWVNIAHASKVQW